jgi:hypothetical protein
MAAHGATAASTAARALPLLRPQLRCRWGGGWDTCFARRQRGASGVSGFGGLAGALPSLIASPASSAAARTTADGNGDEPIVGSFGDSSGDQFNYSDDDNVGGGDQTNDGDESAAEDRAWGMCLAADDFREARTVDLRPYAQRTQ